MNAPSYALQDFVDDGSTPVIYCLCGPDQVPAYVGFTSKTLAWRLYGHLHDAKRAKHHRANWISKLVREGVKPEIHPLMRTTMETWQDAEIAAIAMLQDLFKLRNATDGGEGVIGLDAETLARIGEASRKRLMARTPEQRREWARQGQAARIANSTPEERGEVLRKAFASMTPEWRSEKARKANAAQTPEQRSANARKANAAQTPEQRSERQRRARAAWTPEQRSEQQRRTVSMNVARTPEQRGAVARKAAATYLATSTPEQRRANAHKAVATRRANAANKI